jgi:hypothetical protein
MPYTQGNKEWNLMALFNKIFDDRMLMRIIGALCIALAIKCVAAHFGIDLMAPFPRG